MEGFRQWPTWKQFLTTQAHAILARDFFTKEVLPHAARLEQQGHPDREHYRRAGELGLLGLSVPEAYGGGGGDFGHEAVVLHEQAHTGEGSLGLAVHSGIVTGYLVAYGNEEQKRRWLPGLPPEPPETGLLP